jgi:hypothetical protein
MGFDLRDAIQDRALKVEFHHHADGLGESGVHRDGKIQGADFPAFDKPAKGRERDTEAMVGVGFGVIALRRRAKCPFDGGIIVKQL